MYATSIKTPRVLSLILTYLNPSLECVAAHKEKGEGKLEFHALTAHLTLSMFHNIAMPFTDITDKTA